MLRTLFERLLPLSVLVCVAGSAALPVSALTPEAASKAGPQVRITQHVDESSLVTLKGTTRQLLKFGNRIDQGQMPISTPVSRLLLTLRRSSEQQADLETYLDGLQNPASPNYHKYLSPEEFGKRWGISDQDLATVQNWLQSNGFAIARINKARTSIEFSGTVGQLQSAFHTQIHSFKVAGEQHFSNVSDVQIPAALAGVVGGVSALNDFRHRPLAVRGPGATFNLETHRYEPKVNLGPTGTFLGVGPADAAAIYNTPTSLNPNATGTKYDGSNVTIGIVGRSNIDLTQNSAYASIFGTGAKPVQVVVDGVDPGVTYSGETLEAYLDTEVSSGIAPQSQVVLYVADSDFEDGVFLAAIRAIDDNQADILSVSYGGCELGDSDSQLEFIAGLWQEASAQGITVITSSGDAGSAGCDDPNSEDAAQYGLAISDLSGTPWNVSVGGTDFDTLPNNYSTYVNSTDDSHHGSAKGYIPEYPWNDSTESNGTIAQNSPYINPNTGDTEISGGGGGQSQVYATPSWQVLNGGDGGRDVPDVAFFAGPGRFNATWAICTSLYTDQNGNPVADCSSGSNGFSVTTVGGTSAAAPAFAGMLALVEQANGKGRLGQANYTLYQIAKNNPSVFHDVTQGNNSQLCANGSPDCSKNSAGNYYLTGYAAGTGYDEATGLGSADVTALVNSWKGVSRTATGTSLTLNPTTITHGQTVTATVHVTGGTFGTSTTPEFVSLVNDLDPTPDPTTNARNITGLDFIQISSSGAGTDSSLNFLPGGSYNVTAYYPGDATLAASTSSPVAVTVAPENSGVILCPQSYDPATGNPISPIYGNIFTLFAEPVASSLLSQNSCQGGPTDGTATGSIEFLNGSSLIASANLTSEGYAEYESETIPAGSYSITAQYSGDASFNASTSSVASLTIAKAAAPATLQASNSSVNAGINVRFSIVLQPASIGDPPSGTVQLSVNGSAFGDPVTVTGVPATNSTYAGATATINTTSLPTGTNSITAVYSGDTNYSTATSRAVTVTVIGATKVTPTVTVTPASSSIAADASLSVSVTVGKGSGTATPTGTVTLSGGGYTSSATLNGSGAATIVIPANSLAVGTDSLSAAYPGDTNYANASGTASVTVTPPVTPTFTVSGTSVNVTAGATSGNTSTVTVTAANGFTGSVAVTAALTSSPSGAANPPTATITGSPVSLTSSATSGTATLTIATTAHTSGALSYPMGRDLRWYTGGGMALACVLLFGIPARRKAWRSMLMVLLFVATIATVTGCGTSGGGGNNPPPPPAGGTTAGTYVFTVTATSGAITATTTVNVNVQ